MAKKPLILGSRGSQLALWQANHVRELLQQKHPGQKVTVKVIKTTGDRLRRLPFEMGGKSLYVKEIEEALQRGKVDVGVHSMKDLPVDLPQGLVIAAVLKRDDPRDVFISKKFDSLLHLPKRSKVGTSSLRRQAALKNFRPDLEVISMKGNVETRLRKLSLGNLDAIILSAAGLIRLGLAHRITEYLPTTLMLPAVGQGAIALEVRQGSEAARLIESLNDIESVTCIAAERAFLKALGGSCRTPIAAFSEMSGINLILTGMVASPDGRELIRDRVEGNIREAALLGEKLAKSLFSQGAREILRTCQEYFKK